MKAEERAAALANDLSEWLDAGIGPRSYEDILAAIRAAEKDAREDERRITRGWAENIAHMHDAVRCLEHDLSTMLESGPPTYLIPPEHKEIAQRARSLAAAELWGMRIRRQIRRAAKTGGSR